MHPIRIFLVALLLGTAAASFALDDTPANREAQIDRLLVANPPQAMLDDMAINVATTLPPDQRAEFIELMTKRFDISVLEHAMRASLARHFSADELAAMADLYESPAGQSAMKKMGLYMADLMPVIQAEVTRAYEELQQGR